MSARPLVAVLLGTDHHPFTRLTGWAAEVRRVTGADVFVQHGATPLPADLDGAAMLGVRDLDALLRRATVVTTHGGPGLIMEARAAGHLPVVVPRDPARGEHVDDHQLRFVARIARTGLVAAATDVPAYRRAVAAGLVAGRTDRRTSGAPAVPGLPGDPGAAVPGGPTGPTAAERFGVLVDQLVRRA